MSRWRAIDTFPDYEVSEEGQVRSYKFCRRTPDDELPRTLVLQPGSNGYLKVELRRDSRSYTRYVHQLVATHFLGVQKPDLEVCHNDSDKMNNRLDNLRYDTRSGNLADRVPRGTHRTNTRLSVGDVRWIKRLLKDFSDAHLAELFGCSRRNINWIRRGVTWSDVEPV